MTTSGSVPYAVDVNPPPTGDDWVGLSGDPLSVDAASAWAVVPSCGAVVAFSGHVRDHSPGRVGVSSLEYEAYEDQVTASLARVVEDIRSRWPDVGRVALLHRHGRLAVTETAVVVVVSAPHRDDAFEAARHGIDTLKATVPIWKRESWAGGESWGVDAQQLTGADAS